MSEERAVARKIEAMTEARLTKKVTPTAYSVWSPEAKAWAKAQQAAYVPPPSIYQRFGRYFKERKESWDIGRVYLNANLMRTPAEPPSYTEMQRQRDEDAERLEYRRGTTP